MSSSELHHNIFYYYGLPEHPTSARSQKQLENNVTKALFNVLHLSQNLRTEFFQWLKDKHNLNVTLTRQPDFEILGNPTPEEEKMPTRILLGIAKRRGSDDEGGHKKPRLFDGKIVGQDWLICIESKLDRMDKDQFEDQKRKIRATHSKVITWKEIHDCFARLADTQTCQQRNEADSLLMEHFNEYLEIAGLIPFTGFKKRHFDFFLGENVGRQSEGERREIKDLLRGLAGELTQYDYGDGKRLSNLYRPPSIHVRRPDAKEYDRAELKFHCRRKPWLIPVRVGFSSDEQKQKTYLTVFAHIEGKDNLNRLARLLTNRDGRGKLTRRLRAERFRKYDIELCTKDWKESLLFLESARIKTENDPLGELATKLYEPAEKGACVSLGRTFTHSDLPSDGESQVKEIAEAMRTLHPFVQFATGTPWENIEWGK